MGRRIGLLGGTFDPVHAGHLDLARTCAQRLALDEVRFLTAHLPPHKEGPRAGGYHRHAMVALATDGEAGFVPDPRELEREGRSYTVDTLRELADERPGAELYFLAGADSLRDLPSWREPEEILRLAAFVAVERRGISFEKAAALHAGSIAEGRVILIEHEPPPVSSTRIRSRLAEGEPLPAGAVAPAVARYIHETGLYRPATDETRP